MPVIKWMEVDGIMSALHDDGQGWRSVTQRAMFKLISDMEAHINGNDKNCPFCIGSEVIVIE